MAWTMASATSGFLGDGPTAVRQGEQGVRLSPLDARSFWHEGLLGQAHYVNGDYEQALEWVRSAVSRNELIRFNQRLLIVTLGALGRREEAAQAARRFLQIQPGFPHIVLRETLPFSRRCIGDLARAPAIGRASRLMLYCWRQPSRRERRHDRQHG